MGVHLRGERLPDHLRGGGDGQRLLGRRLAGGAEADEEDGGEGAAVLVPDHRDDGLAVWQAARRPERPRGDRHRRRTGWLQRRAARGAHFSREKVSCQKKPGVWTKFWP